MLEALLLRGMRRLYLENSGPGNKLLLVGDTELGFMGYVGDEELFTADEIINQSGLGRFNFEIVSEKSGWFKFIYKNRIIYIRKKPLVSNVSWANIYESGLIYGTKGDHGDRAPGPFDLEYTKKEQFVYKQKEDTTKEGDKVTYTLNFRSIKGLDNYLTAQEGNDENNEWVDLILNVLREGKGELRKNDYEDLWTGDYHHITASRNQDGTKAIFRGRLEINGMDEYDVHEVDELFAWTPVVELVLPNTVALGVKDLTIESSEPSPIVLNQWIDKPRLEKEYILNIINPTKITASKYRPEDSNLEVVDNVNLFRLARLKLAKIYDYAIDFIFSRPEVTPVVESSSLINQEYEIEVGGKIKLPDGVGSHFEILPHYSGSINSEHRYHQFYPESTITYTNETVSIVEEDVKISNIEYNGYKVSRLKQFTKGFMVPLEKLIYNDFYYDVTSLISILTNDYIKVDSFTDISDKVKQIGKIKYKPNILENIFLPHFNTIEPDVWYHVTSFDLAPSPLTEVLREIRNALINTISTGGWLKDFNASLTVVADGRILLTNTILKRDLFGFLTNE